MNRLVIVGNGFDLANGLKSRYEDFLVWFFKKEVDLFRGHHKFNSEFFAFNELTNVRYHHDDYHQQYKISEIESNKYFYFSHHADKNHRNFAQIKVTIKSPLLEELWQNSNWTDIEYAYFDFLKLNQNKGKDFLQELNKHFVAIKNEFVQYLNSDDAKNTYEINSSLRNVINIAVISGTPIAAEYQGHRRRILENGMGEDPLQLETLVLNFNYTQIFGDVLAHFQMDGHVLPITNIHGTTDNPDSIIFGYGDEMTEEFKKFQEANNDELIKHFKSFYYASGDEYLNLLGFISQGAFDVVVIGHSLGLSDRVLLNTIFENENCKFIHLFHTGGDSHFRKRMALSRHFNDPAKFREKLMPENPNFKMQRN